VARDITRRTQEEEKRKEFEIKALAQDKLASLGEIATGVAHEINQPLSYIKIILESTLNDLSNNQLDATELNEDFLESLRQVGKITKIISHLRTFGRSDVDSFNPVSLPEVLEDSMILMQERLRIKNISINKQIADNLPMIYGNHVKLEQIFINLLQNSMDALEEQGKGKIDLVMEQADDNVIVRFSDNGPGMPPEVLEKIFEPFYTTKEVGQGTGIGLAIMYGIIQEHKGSITCASEVGQGASFTIKLPVYKEKFPAFTSEFSNA
jgi:C4-dicarboxylate-specific signal transduction histidine kinase